MKSMRRILYLLAFCVLLSGLFFGLGDKIMFGKSIFVKIIPCVLIFVGIPFFLYKFLQTFRIKRSLLVGKIVPLSILILGPGFGFWAKYASENDFKNYGKQVYGKITSREWSGQRPGGWVVSAEFEYDSKKYETFSKSEKSHQYEIGEAVLVRFSTRNPENNELVLK
ncbi:hypothetical protein D3C71_1281830 [compost metagenome]